MSRNKQTLPGTAQDQRAKIETLARDIYVCAVQNGATRAKTPTALAEESWRLAEAFYSDGQPEVVAETKAG